MNNRVAVVTGGNRGMGYETCRALGELGFTVILTARDKKKGEDAANKLKGDGLDLFFFRLDVTSDKDIDALAAYLEEKFAGVDVLVNSAGVLDRQDSVDFSTPPTLADVSVETVRDVMEINTLGPLALCQAVIPLMQKGKYGRIVNVSSRMGQLENMTGGYPAYRMSKAALNALTCILADELKDANIKVNAASPGWVRTDMGGEAAHRSVEDGVDTTIWLATLPDDGPSGGFFRDREPIPW